MEDLAEDRRVGKAGIEGVKKVMGGGLDDGGEGLNLISVDVQEKEDLGREVRAIREDGRGEWVFTGFYGHPDTIKRRFSWELLARINTGKGTAWCVAGDFNEIFSQKEKVGGKMRVDHQMAQFQVALESNNLYDAGCVGNPFIWSNRHSDHTCIKERLDRFLVNVECKGIFRDVVVEGLVVRSSDHKAVLLSVVESERRLNKMCYVFKFEASWLKEEECKTMVERARRYSQFLDLRVTSTMNDDLQKPFTREEVEIALRQMGPYKSLGPDGYNACFYQVCWSTVGEDSEAALDFLNGDVWVEKGSPVQKWSYGEVDMGLVWKKMVERLKEED
ncbi:uncharacterized protein LOC122296871 [Carya illinoinensis]|uniref:uncharacterized protein LOC122296871 n=1 Tax=Carya illinoinensis TaxID=32201 RepID=UPI001C71E275|nr:uncharacterized protein LOC122296871 [Carya illinoinensis]